MPSYRQPGTYITESLATTQTNEAGSTTTAIFLGSHFRGPTEPTLVDSWSKFVSTFGGFAPVGAATSELPYAIFNYFSNGGRSVYVVRVLGTGAVAATVVLSDRAGVPAQTLRVSALNPGTWGNDLRVAVVDRDPANGRFDLVVFKGGTTPPFQVERWDNLSMIETDPRHVERVINSLTTGSSYIRVEDVDSATAGAAAMPAVTAGTALAGGADGAAPTNAERLAAVSAGGPLDRVPGFATVHYPGEVTASVLSGLIGYAEDRGNLFVVVDVPVGASTADLLAYEATLPASSYRGLYGPHVYTTDPNNPSSDATRLSPAGAFVVGKIAEVDTIRGPWKAPAGLGTRVNGVLGVERSFTVAEQGNLNVAGVNLIRQIPGTGVVIMGARTGKRDSADMYVNVRRNLNYIKESLKTNTAFATFENNDQDLWNSLSTVAARFLGQMHEQRGLKGTTPDQAFFVKSDDDLNTPATIAQGQVVLEVGVALHKPAEFIVIRIGQWEGGAATAVESQ